MIADYKQELLNRTTSLVVVGMGYVGMPMALEFSKRMPVIGFDINSEKIDTYKKGIDPTGEVGNQAISDTSVIFTDNEGRIKDGKVIIVAVPTPIMQDKTPDLTPVIGASQTVGRNLSAGSLVIFESTVYPGVTEDVCLPILEQESGMVVGKDFFIGYSPERINPGDKTHTFATIKKVVAGMNEEVTTRMSEIYQLVVTAGTHEVSSIRCAEAIKVAENSQRDINIAFVNELAMVFDRMGIDTNEVIDGMNTKWNALGFRPGLVGGHCIGVDPYYFTYQAEKLGYHSQVILSGRRVNDEMGSFVADKAICEMIRAGQNPSESKVAILGLAFKEDCPDARNSKVGDIINRLRDYHIEPLVCDPLVTESDAQNAYGVTISSLGDCQNADCIIISVSHASFRKLGVNGIADLLGPQKLTKKVVIDVKAVLPPDTAVQLGCHYWRL